MYKKGCKQVKYLQDKTRRGREQKDIDKEEDCAEECHKVKLYDINLQSKSTDTKAVVEKKKEEPKEEKPAPDIIQYETYSFTGKFRDEARRIDLILVLAETDKPDVKKLQTDFLLSIIKTGLQVESEPGLMPAHRSLTFIKIHAPDSVLEEYGEKLGVKKYFKDVHVEYIPPKIMKYIENKEKEWIYLVRDHYEEALRYSNSDRSLLVYKILLSLRFGEHQNTFGLKRLLNWNIVSDVYALHDGPYFLTRKQKISDVNARQILYYNWTGWTNIFNLQPINLIQEYFGSRIGFYFAFLQFYCLGLAVAGLVGILSTLFGVVDQTYASVRKGSCNADGTYICPRCYDFELCPFLELKDYYCLGAKLVNLLDHLMLPAQSFFLLLWGTALMIFWKRKETYWIWIWELYQAKNMINSRPEFSINYNKPSQSDSTGLWKYYNSGLSKIIRLVVTLAFYVACVHYTSLIFFNYLFPYKMKLLHYIRPEKLPHDFEKYVFVAAFTSIYLCTFIIFEKIFHLIAVYVTKFENHRSTESYDRSLAVKLFFVTSFSSYPILIFYAWFKTRLFYMPGYQNDPQSSKVKIALLTEGFQRTCGPHPCIDEVFVALTVCFMIKQVLPKLIFIFKQVTWPIRTDYNQGKSIIKKYPCWEREYRLKSINEDRITAHYNYLTLQFGYIILFGAASPLLSVVALILNLIDIRITAKHFLLASRKPLLLDKYGLDIWSTFFTILAWSSILSNAILLGWNSRIGMRYVYSQSHDNTTDFFHFTLSKFLTTLYTEMDWLKDDYANYTGFKPDVCYFQGAVILLEDFQKLVKYGSYFYYLPRLIILPSYYDIKIYNQLILLSCHYLGVIAVLLMQFLIPPTAEDVEDSIKTEKNIKDAFLTHSNQ